MKHNLNTIKSVWNTSFIFVLIIFIGCTPDPIKEFNQSPTVTLSVTVNTNKTLSGNLIGTDSDGTISLKEIIIKNGDTSIESLEVSGTNWTSQNSLAAGNYTITGTVTDNDGATASKSSTKTILGLEITITDGTISFEENETTNQETIATINNVNNISGVSYSLDTDSQNYFEITNNKIKVKSGIVFDFENAPNAITITASATGENDAQQNINLTIIDKNDRLEDIVIKATHCKAGFAKVDVADNDPNTENIIEYALDHNGKLTDRTFEDVKALIDGNTSYPHPGGNFLDIITRMEFSLTKNDDGNTVFDYTDATTTDPAILHRTSFSFTNLNDDTTFTQTADQITRPKLKEVYGFAYDELQAAGYDDNDPNIGSADAWLALNGTTGDSWFYSGFTVTFSEIIAREQDSRSLNELYVYAAIQALNIVKSKTSVTEMKTLVRQYMDYGRITNKSLLQDCN